MVLFVRRRFARETVVERHEFFERDTDFQAVPAIAIDPKKTVVGPKVGPLKAEYYQFPRY